MCIHQLADFTILHKLFHLECSYWWTQNLVSRRHSWLQKWNNRCSIQSLFQISGYCLATKPGLQKSKMAANFEEIPAFRLWGVWTRLVKICRNSAFEKFIQKEIPFCWKGPIFAVKLNKTRPSCYRNGKRIMFVETCSSKFIYGLSHVSPWTKCRIYSL